MHASSVQIVWAATRDLQYWRPQQEPFSLETLLKLIKNNVIATGVADWTLKDWQHAGRSDASVPFISC